MPSEDRVIIFNYDEVYTALRIHAITQKVKIPSEGSIQTITFPDKNTKDSHVSLKLKKDDGEIDTLEFTLDFFARALVFFCQGNNIPVPRAGTKEITHKGDTIILHIKLS